MRSTAKVLQFPPPQVIKTPSRAWWKRLDVLTALIFSALVLLHSYLLSLPYFWDEAGYYIPAARDILYHFQLIPTSTLTNAHPPLVMLWLALGWKIFGYHIVVARLAMLVVAAFTLTGVFRLALQVANRQVALASVVATALFPVFFAQSSLAHVDMAAAGFTIWAFASYLRDDYPSTTIWFALAGMAKETAILAPAALAGWELLGVLLRKSSQSLLYVQRPTVKRAFWLLVALVPLAAWFIYHYRHTGHIFGNPEFVRYNVASTLHPLRIVAAFAERLWQLFGYLNMLFLTIVFALAMTRKPLEGRSRIEVPVQVTIAVLMGTYALALSVVGGAVLARYLLPVYPLLIIIFVSTLWRRLPAWHWFLAVVCIGFILALVLNPPYHFAPEDNLAYADFVRLHQDAAQYLQQHPPSERVLTAWPGSDELTKPYLGYVKKTIPVISIEDFSIPQMMAAHHAAGSYDEAFVFSTKYEPANGFMIRLPFWEDLQRRYFGYHADVSSSMAAAMLQGQIVWQEKIGGFWAAILQLDRAWNARATRPQALASH